MNQTVISSHTKGTATSKYSAGSSISDNLDSKFNFLEIERGFRLFDAYIEGDGSNPLISDFDPAWVYFSDGQSLFGDMENSPFEDVGGSSFALLSFPAGPEGGRTDIYHCMHVCDGGNPLERSVSAIEEAGKSGILDVRWDDSNHLGWSRGWPEGRAAKAFDTEEASNYEEHFDREDIRQIEGTVDEVLEHDSEGEMAVIEVSGDELIGKVPKREVYAATIANMIHDQDRDRYDGVNAVYGLPTDAYKNVFDVVIAPASGAGIDTGVYDVDTGKGRIRSLLRF